jgi:hypothetical protein
VIPVLDLDGLVDERHILEHCLPKDFFAGLADGLDVLLKVAHCLQALHPHFPPQL